MTLLGGSHLFDPANVGHKNYSLGERASLLMPFGQDFLFQVISVDDPVDGLGFAVSI